MKNPIEILKAQNFQSYGKYHASFKDKKMTQKQSRDIEKSSKNEPLASMPYNFGNMFDSTKSLKYHVMLTIQITKTVT